MTTEKVKINFEKFNCWYAEKRILFDINLKIHPNNITALIGPSGCGKSTLLRCINRMNDLITNCKVQGRAYYDKILIHDQSTDVVALRKKIGMVFQKPNPFPMSIFDNVAYGLRVQNIKDKHTLQKIVQQSLEKAELWNEVKDRLHLPAFKLSGGQQQRLCIARALAVKPDILLLDEPCSALDPIATAKIEALLQKLKEEMTVIIVTHNMQQAKRISDYTCYLLDGKIIEYSPTEEIFNHPKHTLTREYLNGEFG